MDFLSFPYRYIKWHYGALLFDVIKIFKVIFFRIKSLFSLGTLSKDIFKSIIVDFKSPSRANPAVSYLIEISLRISGFLFKIFTIVLYPIVVFSLLLLLVLILILWVFLPPFILTLFVKGLILLFV